MSAVTENEINPFEFDYVSTKLREFFKSKGLVECAVQQKRSILAACEDPNTIATFDFAGETFPLPQTGQMHLENYLLKNPNAKGFFCYSTSYRQEPNAKPGRHNLIFPMIEFEIPGPMTKLLEFEKELLEYLGYGPKENYKEDDYLTIAKKYNVTELDHFHEEQLYKDYGPVFFIKKFPETTSPFWNMSRDQETGLADKIDVILSGIETIGSAARSCDVKDMRNRFYTISDGLYSKKLFSKFGEERVKRELEEFLTYDFHIRSGGGIGVNRLCRSLKMEGLL